MKQLTFDIENIVDVMVLRNAGIEPEELLEAHETIETHKEQEALGWRNLLDLSD